jgi:hypothetical protein
VVSTQSTTRYGNTFFFFFFFFDYDGETRPGGLVFYEDTGPVWSSARTQTTKTAPKSRTRVFRRIRVERENPFRELCTVQGLCKWRIACRMKVTSSTTMQHAFRPPRKCTPRRAQSSELGRTMGLASIPESRVIKTCDSRNPCPFRRQIIQLDLRRPLRMPLCSTCFAKVGAT